MDIKKQWKIAAGAVAIAGFSVGGFAAASADDQGPSTASAITLRDTASVNDTADPKPVDVDIDDRVASPDGESLDSPLQSADDSPVGGDSVNTPGDDPRDDSVLTPDPTPDLTPDSSPDRAPAAAPAPAPAPAPAQPSYDSPDSSPARPAPAATPAPAPAPAPRPAPAPVADDSPASPVSVDSADSPD